MNILVLALCLPSCGKNDARQKDIDFEYSALRTQASENHKSFSVKDIQIEFSSTRLVRVKAFINKEWKIFSTTLPRVPRGNLTQVQVPLFPTGEIYTALVCLNQNCSLSKVTLTNRDKMSVFFIKKVKMHIIPAELLKGCDTPIFFPYERDLLLERMPALREDLQKIKKWHFALVTQVRGDLWDKKTFNSFRAEMMANFGLVTLSDDFFPRTPRQLQIKSNTAFHIKNFSYDIVPYESGALLSDIIARYPAEDDVRNTNEICVKLQLIPMLF